MKINFTLIFILLYINCCIAQVNTLHNKKIKPVLDTSILDKWPSVSDGAITNDGKYISYVVRVFTPAAQSVTIVQTPDAKWKKELRGISDAKFTYDSRYLVYKKEHDSLCILKLGTSTDSTYSSVQSFQLVPHLNGEWLVYQFATKWKQIVLRDIKNGNVNMFDSLDRYIFSKDGQVIINQHKSNDNKEISIEWINLLNKKRTILWSGVSAKPIQIVFKENSSQLAFTTENNGHCSVWYFKAGDQSATELANDIDINIREGFVFGSLQRFSKDGSRLFLMLENKEVNLTNKVSTANVNLWSYRDLMPQSEQLIKAAQVNSLGKSYLSALSITNGRILRFQDGYEKIIDTRMDGEYCIIQHLDANQEVSPHEADWSPAYKNSITYLVSLQDGIRRKLPWKGDRCSFSPGGKFIVYSDPSLSTNYYSYEISTGISRNITERIKTDLTSDAGYRQPITKSLLPIVGWLKDDAGVLVNDRYDLWLVDPLGKQVPDNITNGFGSRHGIMLRLQYSSDNNKWISSGEELTLVAFNKKTKASGFYKVLVGQKKDPEILTMGNNLYTSIPLFSRFSASSIIKAKEGNAWLIMRETVQDAPNYYWSNDLKTFRQVSYLNPEKSWNWFTSELHSWTAPDGDVLQGVLYKPENFNPSHKYPVIFSYYRQLSDELNSYRKPDWSTDRINIPWFVSHGYLVFTPDVHHNVPNLKESVLNCLISAAKYISKLSFVDKSRMGIQGHSFGGLETGYLITNTNMFSAACAASGYYNLTTDVCTIMPRSGTVRNNSEQHMGGALWEYKNDFINNSPFYFINKVNTPLLLMTGRRDGNVPHDQTVEFFLGLRRLNKTAWMLDYEDGSHTLDYNKKAAVDYTIRMQQFFDHFLKNAPARVWMTKGIPARLKGIETGYAYDPSNGCGKDCKNCRYWNEKYKEDSLECWKEIEEGKVSEHWQ